MSIPLVTHVALDEGLPRLDRLKMIDAIMKSLKKLGPSVVSLDGGIGEQACGILGQKNRPPKGKHR